MSEVLRPWDVRESPSILMQQNTVFGPRLFDNSRVVGDAYALPSGGESALTPSNAWQSYGDEAHEQQKANLTTTMTQPPTQPKHTPHNRIKQNRRAFSHSHSTAQLYESRPPLHTRGNLQHSATFDGSSTSNSSAIFDTSSAYDADQSISSHHQQQQQQHLPTPSHTPTSDSFMLDRLYNKNRSKSVTQADSHRGMQSAMLEQLSFDSNTPNRSPGLSVSSYGPDMPATPRTVNSDYGEDPYNAASGEPNTSPFFDLSPDHSSFFEDLAMRHLPKVTRTMPDFYQDDIFNASNITSAPSHGHSSQPQKSSLLSPYRNMVNDRLQAAQDMRTLSPSGNGSRTASPFRQSSPYARSASLYGHANNAQGQSQQLNGHSYAQSSSQQAQALQQQTPYQNGSEEQQKTISPKDAVLDFHEPAEESASSLFPENSAERRAFGSEMGSYGRPSSGDQLSPSTYGVLQGQFSFHAPSNLPVSLSQSNSQEYKFPMAYRQASNMSSTDQLPDFPAHLAMMESTKSEHRSPSTSPRSPVSRPSSTMANTGTYTCTYQGCTQRFASPALLQKHKKEGHRSTGSRAKSQTPDDGSSPTGLNKNSQAGPHRCDRVNPSTGKPCNVVFSRPYDLTRHEDTIHAQRTKVRCQYCSEEKTFSRNDALTRHMRVVHPHISFPGKHRRRNVT